MTFEPMPTAEQYKKALRFVSRIVLRNKLKQLLLWLNRYETGYDIGAGLGQYTLALRQLGYSVIAAEPLRGYCPFAIQQKAEDLTVKMDYAYLLNVLHHSDDPIKLLAHLKILCPKLIISELNRRNLAVRCFVKIFLPWETIDGHLDQPEVRTMLSLAGWEINKAYRTSLLGIPRVYNWFICKRSSV